jgi:HK97 family phage major capsid protein
MDRATEMLQQRAKLIEDARGLLDKADKENRNLDATEKESYEKLLADSDILKERADRTSQLSAIEKEIRSIPASTQVATIGSHGQKVGDSDDPHSKLFRTFLVQGEEAAKRENRDLSATVLSAGGSFVAPSEWVAELIKFMDNALFMRQMARVFKLNSAQSLGFPTLDTDPTDPVWTTEVPAAAPTADTAMATGARELKPSPLIKLLKVSTTLLQASVIPIESFVAERLAYKFGAAEENAYLNGTGSGQPLGIFTASTQGITTARDVATGNLATAPTFDGLIEAKYSIKPQYWAKLAWVMNKLVQKTLVKLKDGEGQYIWRQSVSASEPDTILGSPVRLSEYAPSTMTANLYVAVLGDFSYYYIADSLAMNIQRLVELYATTRQIGFLGTKDTDGMPVLAEAFARVKLAAS